MNEVDKKRKFKSKLAGEIDWKEYAMWQTLLLVEAEEREKEFCGDSRYFMDADTRLHERMGLTREEVDYALDEFVKWMDENDYLYDRGKI